MSPRTAIIVGDDGHDSGDSSRGRVPSVVTSRELPELLDPNQASEIVQQLMVAYRNGDTSHYFESLLGAGGLRRVGEIVNRARSSYEAESMLLGVVREGIRKWNAETEDSRRTDRNDRDIARLIDEWKQDLRAAVRGVAITGNALARVGVAVAAIAALVLGARYATGDYFAKRAAVKADDETIASFALEGTTGRRTVEVDSHDGTDLEGASVRFPCVPHKVSSGPDGDKYELEPALGLDQSQGTSELVSLYGVDFEEGVDPAVSIAQAGYGTTVLFTPGQRRAELPEKLGAVSVYMGGSSDGSIGTSYYLPTAAFIPDSSGVFVTGARDSNGDLIVYYPVGAGGDLACDGETEKKSPYMVDATLSTDEP